jgi:hypothetical protein
MSYMGRLFCAPAVTADRERDAVIRRSVTGRPEPKWNRYRFGAWLALLALALQVGFATEHSARHFDHLVGPLGASSHGIAASGALDRHKGSSPCPPASPDLDHCAIGLGLLAGASVVLAGSAPLPAPTGIDPAYLEAAPAAPAPRVPRHFRPPPRAPPVIGMSA